MVLLICGSRSWNDAKAIRMILRGLHPDSVVHGAARGADSIAGQICRRMGIPVKEYPADFDRYGRAGGPIRNQAMLDASDPDMVAAFKDKWDRTLRTGGTEDMIKRAKKAKVPVYVVERV